MSELLKDGFVDESRYASAFASEKSALTGWGPIKIRRALMAKGVPSDVIDTALAGTDRDKADAKLEKLMAGKCLCHPALLAECRQWLGEANVVVRER
mgnify:CR=1 FL=1